MIPSVFFHIWAPSPWDASSPSLRRTQVTIWGEAGGPELLSSSLHLSLPGHIPGWRADFHTPFLYYACISDCKKMMCHPFSILSQRHQSVTFTYLGFTSSSWCFSVGFDAGKMPKCFSTDWSLHPLTSKIHYELLWTDTFYCQFSTPLATTTKR